MSTRKTPRASSTTIKDTEVSRGEDAHLKVLCGVAHTGGAPFARVGYWGDVAWRPRREFVRQGVV